MYISNINSSSIKVHSIQTETITGKEPVIIKTDDHVTILCIVQGGADYELPMRVGKTKKADVLVLNPSTTLEIKPHRKMEWLKLDLSGIEFISSVNIDTERQHFKIEDDTGRIRAYLELALLEDKHAFEGTALILRKISECIIAQILKNRPLTIKDDNDHATDDGMQVVQNFIRENYAQKITLDQLADLIGMKKYYFIRVFRQSTGLSPIDYLIQIRILESEKLLKESHLTIANIANRIGFHSPSYFTKTFKDVNQCTPSEYRKRHKIS